MYSTAVFIAVFVVFSIHVWWNSFQGKPARCGAGAVCRLCAEARNPPPDHSPAGEGLKTKMIKIIKKYNTLPGNLQGQGVTFL